MPTNWMNDDGLYIKFGTNEATPGYGGESSTDGNMRVITLTDIDTADIGSSPTILDYNVRVPGGVMINKVTVRVTEAFATGDAADLNIGLAESDMTELDYDGFLDAADDLVAAPVGSIWEYTQGSTDHGALIGAVTTTTLAPFYITFDTDTGTYTSGKFDLEIEYYVPNTN